MNIRNLLNELADLGVELWLENGALRYRAPSGIMNDTRLTLLRQHKGELVEALENASLGPVSDEKNRFEHYPLTGLQSAYLLGRREVFTLGGVDCHGYLEFRFETLDLPRLQQAWQQLVNRHDMLRTVVHNNGSQQTLETPPNITLACVDVRPLPEAIQQQTLTQQRERLSHYRGEPENWPLVRIEVTQMADCAVLHVSVNLLICDFQSARQLLAELNTLYEGKPLSSPAAISFRDYVLAMLREKETPAYQRARDYWLARIENLPAAPSLTASKAALTPNFYRHGFTLAPAQFLQLSEIAAGHNLGVSTVFLTAYAETLRRWGAQSHFAIAMTMMQREPLHADVDKLIGDFSAVELLEVNLAAGSSVIAQAQTLQQQLWQDLDHAKFTGVEVMRELSRQRGREAAHYPVAFTSAIASGMDCQTRLLPGATQTYGITQTPQVALDCQIGPGEEGLVINWDIREGTLDNDAAAAMFSAFRQSILTLCNDVNAWHRPLSLPLPAEQQQRRQRANDTQSALPEALIHAGIWQQAQRTPEATAVVDARTSLDYRTLISRAEALASQLLHRGVKPGQLVAVALDKSVEQIVAVLACLRAGAAYLPLDLTLPVKRQAWLVSLAQPALVLTQSGWPVLTEPDCELPPTLRVDALNHERLPAVWPSVALDSLAYVIFTSGSTGEPKGVMVSHAAANNTLEDINQRLNPIAGDRILGLANLSFDLSVYDIFGILGCGATLVLPDSRHRSDPARLADAIAQHGITLWNSVPAQLAMLADYLHSGSAADCTTLRAALLSGDWIPVDLADRIRQKIPNIRLNGLGGATEVSIWSVLYPIEQVESDWQSIPYGKPLANQQLHVLDAEMRDCPENVAGELYIGGKGLAIGYLGDEQRTAQRFITHPLTAQRLYRTGDLACHLPDGNLQFLGREDNQLKIRGHRIELAEIESTLTRHPDIAAAAALVIDRNTPAQRLVAFATPVQTRSCPSLSTLAETLPTLAHRLANDMDRPQVLQVADGIEQVSLKAMAQALLSLAAFQNPGSGVSLTQLVSSGDVAPRHERLIARWLTTLTREGYLLESRSRENAYLPVREISAQEVEQDWDRLEQLNAKVNWGSEILRYMRDSHRHLVALMRNEADPLDLLFPEGQTHVAEAAYRDNLVSRTMNALVCGVVGHIAAEKNGETLRLLEVGAGVGGTSLDLIPSLKNHAVDYLFSDVSNYFLNEAEKRFSAWPWVRYGLYDINQPPLKQGIEPSSRDVVLCCNVLHNARHAGDVIAKLREVLAPGGWLVFIEATSNSYQIMSSMEFKEGLSGFEDCRGEENTTFLTPDQWRGYLQQAGADRVLIAPEFDLGLDTLGQHVFAAQFKTAQADVTPADLQSHLQQWLPAWMQPDSVHLLDALPLTENGKVDRRTLSALTPDARHSQAARSEPPVGALEKDIAAIWQSVLKIDEVGRHDNFFTLGGDSLLVAQTVSRMRSHLPQAAGWRWDTLLRTMMNEGTVAALAEQFGQASDSFYSLKELQAGDANTTTLLLIHDGSGTLSPYRDLLHKLDKNQRVLGLALNSPEAFLRHPAGDGIAFLAAEAVQTLRQRQQTASPLHIVGYCLGGMLASEIAHQLAADGTEIRQLSIISSYPVPFRIEDDLLVEYIFARVMQASPAELGYPTDEQGLQTLLRSILQETPGVIPQDSLARFTRDRQDPMSQAIQRLAARTPAERLAAIGQKMPQTTHELNSASRLTEQYRLIQHSLWAVNGHRARQTTRPMTFLRQRGEMQVLPGMNHEMTDFWQQQTTQPLAVHDVAGDHFSCLDAQHIDEILRVLGLEQEGAQHD